MSRNTQFTPGQRESLKYLSESKQYFEVDAAAGIGSALITGGWLTREKLHSIGRSEQFRVIDRLKYE